ncbi:lamin tail domain-containing protein [bacterium SCSIO 12741]|nr:lamin tail domain-containing protein [bacterium SCSIO 12741]
MKKLFTLLTVLALSLSGMAQIVITEISYNPPESGSDSTEFIEILNTGSSTVNLNGYQFTSGVVYTFPSINLASGAYLVIAVDSVAIMNVYGVAARQWSSGGLSNGGEPIALKTSTGVLVDSLRYDDVSPWPTSPDGGGASLVLCDSTADNTNGANWSASTTLVTGKIVNSKQVYGSPGTRDAGCTSTPPPPASIPTYPIGTVTSSDPLGVVDSNNVECRLVGIVQGIDIGGSSATQFHLNDGNGIVVRKSGGFTPSYTVTEGDSVEVYGTVGHFNGLIQLNADSMNVLATGKAARMPMLVAEPNETYEAELIRVDSVTIIGGSWPSPGSSANMTVASTKLDTFTMRVDRNTLVDDSVTVAPVGMFDVIGFGGQFDFSSPYDEGYQLVPQVKGHIIPHTTAPPPPPAALPTYPIGTVTTVDVNGETDSLNVKCRITGIVHGVDLSGTSSSSNTFTITDASGGIGVFKGGGFTPAYTVRQGDSVEAWGSISQYNGLTQFSPDSMNVLDSMKMPDTPMKVSALGESTESRVIRIDSVELVDANQWPATGSNSNVQIRTLAGDTLTMRIDKDTYIDDSVAAPVGRFDVCGIGGQFDFSSPYFDGYQIIPQFTKDIKPHPAATCNDPSALGATNISDVSAELTWTTGGSNEWMIEWGTQGFTPGTGTRVHSITNPHLLSGLTPNTAYDFYVQDSCATIGLSNQVGPFTFTTLAAPKPLPLYPIDVLRTVDANGEPDSNNVDCRIVGTVFTPDFDGNNGISFWIQDGTAGINVFNFNDVSNYVVEEGDSIMVWGSVGFYNGLTEMIADSIQVLATGKMIEGPWDADELDEDTESEWISICNVKLADPSEWPAAGSNANVNIVTMDNDTLTMRIDKDVFIQDSMPNPPSGMFSVMGVGNQFDASSPYFDGYQINPRSHLDFDTSVCGTPTAITVDSAGKTTAAISWTSGGGSEWDIRWYQNGTPVDSAMGLTSTNYSITGLTENTTYEVWIFEVCDLHCSEWTGPESFTTDSTATGPDGVNELNGKSQALVAYPNPNNTGTLMLNKTVNVVINNLLGQPVLRSNDSNTIDISGLDTGIYLILTDEYEAVRLIVK